MGIVRTVSDDNSNSKYSYNPYSVSKNANYLEEKLEEVKNKQGILGNIWNGFKEATTLGVSSSDCESMLNKYKQGELSFEEAAEYINSFDNKQENTKGLMSNILTGIGSIAASVILYSNPATITAGMAIKAGVPTGAILKTGINLIDRATNNIEGDEFDVKTMAKDALSGAITGTTSAVSSGVGKGIKNADFGLSVRKGIQCGTLCGATSGAGSYIIDTAFDENKDFDLEEMIKNSATSAFVSGTVGGIVGAGMYETANLTGSIGQSTTSSIAGTITHDSTTSSIRKVLGNIMRTAGNTISKLTAKTA